MHIQERIKRLGVRMLCNKVGAAIRRGFGFVGLVLLIPILIVIAVMIAAVDTEEVQSIRRQS
jgi:hypothetical protein